MSRKLLREKMPAETVKAVHKTINSWFNKKEGKLLKDTNCYLCSRFHGGVRDCELDGERCPLDDRKEICCKAWDKWSDARNGSVEKERLAQALIEKMVRTLPAKEQEYYW